MVLYKSGKEVLVLRFNASNSDNKNWFSEGNILQSPWEDILSKPKLSFKFDAWPLATGYRAFYIVKAHVYCEEDSGWLSVGDSKDCNWEIRMPDGIKIVYSKLKTFAVYDNTSKLRIFNDIRAKRNLKGS